MGKHQLLYLSVPAGVVQGLYCFHDVALDSPSKTSLCGKGVCVQLILHLPFQIHTLSFWDLESAGSSALDFNAKGAPGNQ